MSRICPVSGNTVLYLDCVDCDKECLKRPESMLVTRDFDNVPSKTEIKEPNNEKAQV